MEDIHRSPFRLDEEVQDSFDSGLVRSPNLSPIRSPSPDSFLLRTPDLIEPVDQEITKHAVDVENGGSTFGFGDSFDEEMSVLLGQLSSVADPNFDQFFAQAARDRSNKWARLRAENEEPGSLVRDLECTQDFWDRVRIFEQCGVEEVGNDSIVLVKKKAPAAHCPRVIAAPKVFHAMGAGKIPYEITIGGKVPPRGSVADSLESEDGKDKEEEQSEIRLKDCELRFRQAYQQKASSSVAKEEMHNSTAFRERFATTIPLFVHYMQEEGETQYSIFDVYCDYSTFFFNEKQNKGRRKAVLRSRKPVHDKVFQKMADHTRYTADTITQELCRHVEIHLAIKTILRLIDERYQYSQRSFDFDKLSKVLVYQGCSQRSVYKSVLLIIVLLQSGHGSSIFDKLNSPAVEPITFEEFLCEATSSASVTEDTEKIEHKFQKELNKYKRDKKNNNIIEPFRADSVETQLAFVGVRFRALYQAMLDKSSSKSATGGSKKKRGRYDEEDKADVTHGQVIEGMENFRKNPVLLTKKQRRSLFMECAKTIAAIGWDCILDIDR